MSVRRQAIGVIAALLAAPLSARAHPAVSAVAVVRVLDGGQFSMTVIHDALAFALNDTPVAVTDEPMYELLKAPDGELADAFAKGRKRFAKLFHLTADGTPVAVEITASPDVAGLRNWEAEHPDRRLPCKLDFVCTAMLPGHAKFITLQFPDVMADVILSVDRPREEPMTIPLAAAEKSPKIDVSMIWPAASGAPSAPAVSTPMSIHVLPVLVGVGVVAVLWILMARIRRKA